MEGQESGEEYAMFPDANHRLKKCNRTIFSGHDLNRVLVFTTMLKNFLLFRNVFRFIERSKNMLV